MSARISSLPVVVSGNILDTDIMPIVTGIAANLGVTKRVSITELRIKLGTTPPAGGRTVTAASKYLDNNAYINPKDFGAFGDGITDDTAAVQAAINNARDNGLLLKGASGARYRITSQLVSQHTGVYVAIDQDWDNATIVVDFSGNDGYLVQGGAALQRIRNLRMIPATARKQTAGGAYAATDSGMRIQNSRVDLQIDSQYFKGAGVVVESSAANSNYSNYDIRADNNGLGVLHTGTNDNLAVCRSVIRASGNSNEGVRCDDTCNVRGWTASWLCEANQLADPNNAAKYGVYVGKAINGEFYIYSEQTGSASEIGFGTASASNIVNSSRRNKDVIFGSNVGRQGQLQYQTSDGISTRYATPSRLMSIAARKANAGEYVEQTFEAGDGVIARARAEANGVYFGSAADRRIGVNDLYQYAGRKRIYSDTVALSTGTATLTKNIATLAAGSAIAARLTVSGAAAAAGMMTSVIDFRVDGTTLTQNAAIVSSAATPNPSTAVLQVAGGILQLVLTYVPGQWGGAYNFDYSIEGTFVNV